MVKKILPFAAVVAAAAIAVTLTVVWLLGDGAPPPKAPAKVAEKPRRIKDVATKAKRAELRARAGARTLEEMKKKPEGIHCDIEDEEDRKVAVAIQGALDAEDLGKVKDLLEMARRSKNAKVRRLMVEALAWFDTKAMLQIAPFLADEDEEVRDTAAAVWEKILQQVEDEQVKVGLIVESLQIVQDEDKAETIASEFQTVDQKLAVDSMVTLLYGTKTVSKAARKKILENYEFLTGEPYTNAQVARQWLRENYTPPEKED